MEETPPPFKTSDKNPWPVLEDQSSSHDGSRRWPERNTRDRESIKCKDTSEWPSRECSQGNKDIQKGDAMDTEVIAFADSSFDEQRERGRLREISRDGEWHGSAKQNFEVTKRNSWHVMEDHSSSRNGYSRGWPDYDALSSSKCKDDSGWSSWESFQENRDMQIDDTVDREVQKVSNNTFDEQRGQSKIRKRGRSRSRTREYSKSRSRSPCNGLRQASGVLFEKGSVSEKTSRRCRDFAAGKCSRGFKCRFLHQGYPRNELTDRSKFRADDRDTIQFRDYKGSSSGPCYKISDNREDYCEEVESRKDAVCWKKSLEGKCLREDLCRYSHHRSSGEQCYRRNERIAYDQNVRPLVEQNDIGHCKFFSSGRCHQNDCRFSHDVGRVTTGFLDAAKTKKCDEVCSLDRPKAELLGRGEDETKSEKCSAWDKFASMSEKPDTTGWGKWPGKPDNHTWNSSSHDSLGGEKTRLNQKILQHGTKLPGREEDEIKSEKCSAWDKFASMSEKPDPTGWGKWPGKPDNHISNSSSHDSLGGENTRLNQKILQHGTKLPGREEDEIKSEECSAWDKFASMSEKPDPTGWGKWPGKPDNHISNSSSHDSLGGENTRLNQKILQHGTKLPGREEDEIKSEKCSAWDKFASMSEKPDTTGWGKWPGKPDNYTWNSSSHDSLGGEKTRLNQKNFQHGTKLPGKEEDEIKSEKCSAWDKFASMSEKPDTTGGEGCSLDRPKATGKGDNATRNRDPRICVDVEECNDGNISHSFMQKGIQNSSSEWNKKVTVRDANRLCPLQNDYNGAGSNTNEVSDAVKVNDGKNSLNQGEDKKNSWNPNCDDSACFVDNTKAGGSKSSNDRHCHDPVDEEKPSQNNLVKMAISVQDNKVVGKNEYRLTHMLNGKEGVDQDTGNLSASKKISYNKENQIDAQGSEPGGFISPPSSLMGLSQSSHALSPNPLNGCHIILDESVKYKLSALVNQMQNQFEEALKILDMWACQNSITADQALRLSKLQAYLSENGVHVKSNEVLEKLKVEYMESSATILKQQEPVESTEPNQKTVVVEKVSGNNSKGEQCKKEEEIIQAVGANEQREAGESRRDEKSKRLFKNALVKLVKEILKPIWKEGQMKKEVHKTIVKKVVDKVLSTESVNITSIQEHTEQYLSFSKPQISALINDYVVHFKRLADSS